MNNKLYESTLKIAKNKCWFGQGKVITINGTNGVPLIYVPYKIGLDIKKGLDKHHKGKFDTSIHVTQKWICFAFPNSSGRV